MRLLLRIQRGLDGWHEAGGELADGALDASDGVINKLTGGISLDIDVVVSSRFGFFCFGVSVKRTFPTQIAPGVLLSIRNSALLAWAVPGMSQDLERGSRRRLV